MVKSWTVDSYLSTNKLFHLGCSVFGQPNLKYENMKPIFFLIYFALSPLLLFGQAGFSKVFQLEPNHANDLNSLVIDNDTIVLFQAAFDTSVNNWGLNLVKLDTLGNILFTNFLSDSVSHFIRSMGGNEIIKTHDRGYAFAATYSWDDDTIFLAKYNHAGEREFVRYYAPPVANTDFFACRTLHQLSDGGFFLMTFYSLDTTNYFSLSLLRVDADGDELWRKAFVAEDTSRLMTSILELDNNSFLLSGGKYRFLPSGENYTFPNIIVLDSLGNILQEWMGEKNTGMLNFIRTDDGGFIYTGGKVLIQGASSKTIPLIGKVDSNFSEEWVHYVNQPAATTAHYTSLSKTPDGHYIASGEGGYPYSERPGIHTKITDSGEVLWERLDRAEYSGVKGTRNLIRSTGVLSSGSIISCGSTWITEPYGYSEKGWLVKISPGGCIDDTDTLDCWAGATVVSATETPQAEAIAIYPNPVDDELTVNLNGYQPKEAAIYFYDLLGRFLRKERVHIGRNMLSVSDLPTGLIFYEVRDSGVLMTLGKLVKMNEN